MVIRACLHQTECTAMCENRVRSTADVLFNIHTTSTVKHSAYSVGTYDNK
jgi:hypothetical protein